MTTKAANPYAPDVNFTDAERTAFQPPTGILPSEWAEKHVVIPARGNAEPGPYRGSRVPYAADIIDAFADPNVDMIVWVAGTQVTKTTSIVICLGWAADEDPGPALFVLPDKEAAQRYNEKKIKPIILSSPRLRRLMSGKKRDWKKLELSIGGLDLRLTYARSASGLASDAMRYLLLDEVDKFVKRAGSEADPVSLAEERLRTFKNLGISKEVLASTPTYPTAYTWRNFKRSDQHYYHVPCPHCGRYQPLTFSRDRVAFHGERDPEVMATERLATYVCVHCEEHIDDRDEIKDEMLARGVWAPEGAKVDDDGQVVGGRRRRVRGFHLNAMYSPFLTWSDVAAEFLKSKSDPAKLMNFMNSWLGLPWEEKTAEVTLEHVAGLTSSHSRSTVTAEALVLTAGCDVQLDVIYYSIRAWGVGERSWLVEEGRVEDFNMLEQALFHRTFKRVGGDEEQPQEALPVRLALIDYQYRQSEVVRLIDKHTHVARPVRGGKRAAIPIQRVKNKTRPYPFWTADVGYFKDKLHKLFHTARGEPGSWLLHREPFDEYLNQVTSEHQVIKIVQGKTELIWQKKTGAGGNHWLDCEVYNLVAAEMLGIPLMLDGTAPTSKYVESLKKPATQSTKPSPEGRIRRRDGGWIRRRR